MSASEQDASESAVCIEETQVWDVHTGRLSLVTLSISSRGLQAAITECQILSMVVLCHSSRLLSSWGMGRCRQASAALAASSFSFFTVSLPMWFSLEMGSSSEGISCFFKFLVLFVTTCR